MYLHNNASSKFGLYCDKISIYGEGLDGGLRATHSLHKFLNSGPFLSKFDKNTSKCIRSNLRDSKIQKFIRGISHPQIPENAEEVNNFWNNTCIIVRYLRMHRKRV